MVAWLRALRNLTRGPGYHAKARRREVPMIEEQWFKIAFNVITVRLTDIIQLHF